MARASVVTARPRASCNTVGKADSAFRRAETFANTQNVTLPGNGTMLGSSGAAGYETAGGFSGTALGVSSAALRGYWEWQHLPETNGYAIGLNTLNISGYNYTDIKYGFIINQFTIQASGTVGGNGPVVSSTEAHTLRIAVTDTKVRFFSDGVLMHEVNLDPQDIQDDLFLQMAITRPGGGPTGLMVFADNPTIPYYAEVYPVETAYLSESDNRILKSRSGGTVLGTGSFTSSDWTYETGIALADGQADAYATVTNSYWQITLNTGERNLLARGFTREYGGTFRVTVNGAQVRTGTQYSPTPVNKKYFRAITGLQAGDVVRFTYTGNGTGVDNGGTGIAAYLDQVLGYP